MGTADCCGCDCLEDLGDESISGLVGGVEFEVATPSEKSSSGLGEEVVVVDEGDVSVWMSGALYDSMFVVCVRAMGLEILLRSEEAPLVELLRSTPALSRLCLTLRVVNALAMDMLAAELSSKRKER